jgi:hypothetical protein
VARFRVEIARMDSGARNHGAVVRRPEIQWWTRAAIRRKAGGGRRFARKPRLVPMGEDQAGFSGGRDRRSGGFFTPLAQLAWTGRIRRYWARAP